MKGNPEERAIALAQYVLEHNATVGSAAKKFGVSKSTVHKDIVKIADAFRSKNNSFLSGGALV